MVTLRHTSPINNVILFAFYWWSRSMPQSAGSHTTTIVKQFTLKSSATAMKHSSLLPFLSYYFNTLAKMTWCKNPNFNHTNDESACSRWFVFLSTRQANTFFTYSNGEYCSTSLSSPAQHSWLLSFKPTGSIVWKVWLRYSVTSIRWLWISLVLQSRCIA